MNFIKKISSVLLALSIGGSMLGVNAFAASKEDVISTAKSSGIRSDYCVMIENYLATNSSFSSADYDQMIYLMNYYGGEYLTKYADEKFGKKVEDLTEQEKEQINNEIPKEEKVEILKEISEKTKDLGINLEVDVENVESGNITVYISSNIEKQSKRTVADVMSMAKKNGVELPEDLTTVQVSKEHNTTNLTQGVGTTMAIENAVTETGGELEFKVNYIAVAIAVLVVTLGIGGVIIVARQNKESDI